MANSLVLGPEATPLEPGRKYACRLRAYDTQGKDLFKNNGYSTVLVFTFGKQCQTPVTIKDKVNDPFEANISWTPVPGNTDFEIAYREKDANSRWYYLQTSENNAKIKQLKPEHIYEYKIKGICGTVESAYSDLFEFTTPKKQPDTSSCDGDGKVPPIDSTAGPLLDLYIGDVINIGGFEGVIIKARGSNGVFSGKCIMRVTTFNVLLKSSFKNISINDKYQVTAGTVIADRGPGNIVNMDNVIATIDSLANVAIDSIVDNPNNYVASLDSVIYNIDPTSLNDTAVNNLIVISNNLDIILQDTALTQEQVIVIEELQNQITSIINNSNNNNQDDNNTFVMFKAFHSQTYGFDEPDTAYKSLLQYYQPPNNIQGQEQLIRWKSVKVGDIDKVIAQLDSTNANIKFYDGNDVEIIPQDGSNDTIIKLNITAQIPEQILTYTAKQKTSDTSSTIVGMLNVVGYNQIKKTLHIIPVNGNTIPGNMNVMQFTNSINKIYGQAVVKWDVYLEDKISFDYSLSDNEATFDAFPPNQVLYTPDMQALINKFKSERSFDSTDYYIFLVDNPENQK